MKELPHEELIVDLQALPHEHLSTNLKIYSDVPHNTRSRSTNGGLTVKLRRAGEGTEQRRSRTTSRRRFAGNDQLRPPEEYPPLTCSSVLDLQRGELGGGVGNGGGSSGGEAEGVK